MPEKNNTPQHADIDYPAGMTLTVLGSGTCVPSLERSASTLLLEIKSIKLLLDIGTGTIRRLLENKTELSDISHILITHFHPDHTGELASFLFSSKYSSLGPRQTPLTLIGGTGICDFFNKLCAVYPGWIELGPELFNIVEVSNTGKDFRAYDDFKVISMPVNHNNESVAFRLEDNTGNSVVYSGDTDYCETLVEIAQSADIFVCESAFPDEIKIPGHLTPALAGKMASAANVRQLVLTHFYPQCRMDQIEKQCRKTYKGPLILARDLMKITV